MAWFSYTCATCGVFKINDTKRKSTTPCPKCDTMAKSLLKAGTAVIHEKLDNGAMGRAVERIHNVEELMDERNEMTKVVQDDEEESE